MPIICQCPICNILFPVAPSRIRRGQGRYCSTKCRGRSFALTLESRFFEKVNKETCLGDICGCHKGLGHCWPWTATTNKHGYGWFSVERKGHNASRVAFYLGCGRWPDPWSLHHCDNRICCRYSHLYEGTPLDNSHDMVKRGRSSHGEKHSKTIRGEINGNTKITEIQAIAILEKLALKNMTQTDIAKQEGVSFGIVNLLFRNITWKYLKDVGIRRVIRDAELCQDYETSA